MLCLQSLLIENDYFKNLKIHVQFIANFASLSRVRAFVIKQFHKFSLHFFFDFYALRLSRWVNI